MPDDKSKKEINKTYKHLIYALCSKVAKGDKAAEQELKEQMDKNSIAVWAVKHWMKQKSKTQGAATSPGRIKAKRSKGYGNAFKPYQGGSPGLGKNS